MPGSQHRINIRKHGACQHCYFRADDSSGIDTPRSPSPSAMLFRSSPGAASTPASRARLLGLIPGAFGERVRLELA
jgi:hypothetical protein